MQQRQGVRKQISKQERIETHQSVAKGPAATTTTTTTRFKTQRQERKHVLPTSFPHGIFGLNNGLSRGNAFFRYHFLALDIFVLGKNIHLATTKQVVQNGLSIDVHEADRPRRVGGFGTGIPGNGWFATRNVVITLAG